MRRYLSIPLLCICGAFVTAAPRDFGILGGKARVGSGNGGLINGITAATLFDGYWTPNEIIDPPSNARPITDFDPAQTTYTYIYDTTTNRALVLAEWARLQTEWSTASQKSSATVDNTIFVDWATGANSGTGSTSGTAFKDLKYAVSYAQANYSSTCVEIRLLDGVQYLVKDGSGGTGTPSGGDAKVAIENYVATATDPLIIRSDSGNAADCILRVDHTYLSDNFSALKAGTVDLNTGIVIKGTTAHVQVWDITLVGPLFEAPYWDGGGEACGVSTNGHSGDGSTIKVIGCELVQWPHCGVKGDLHVYGSLIHSSGVSDGTHDHGYYMSDGGTSQTIIGSIVLNSFGNGLNPRNYDLNGVVIRGNIIGHSKVKDIDLGGYQTEVDHNLFLTTGSVSLQVDGDIGGGLVRNNIFYVDGTLSLQGTSGAYIKPLITFATNADIAATTLPTMPTITAWTASTTVTRPASVSYAGNYYYNQSTAAGNTGTTAPTHTSGDVSDGNITWRFAQDAAPTYGTFTEIDSADFNDKASFDHRPATGSDLLSNGTDIGYGTTIGPFSTAP